MFIFPLGLKINYKELHVLQSPCFVLNTTVNFIWSLIIKFFVSCLYTEKHTHTVKKKEIKRIYPNKKSSLFQGICWTEGISDTHDTIKITHCTEVNSWHEASNFTGISPSCTSIQLPNFSCTELFLVRQRNKVMGKNGGIILFQQSREMSIICFESYIDTFFQHFQRLEFIS